MSFQNRVAIIQRRLQSYPGAERDASLASSLLLEAQAIGQALVEGDWGAMRYRSLRSMGTGMAALYRLQGVAPLRTSDATVAVARTLQNAYRSIAASPNRDELLEKLRIALDEVGGPDAVARVEDSLAAIAQGNLTETPLWKAHSRRSTFQLPLSGVDQLVAAVTRGLLGLAHFEFNRAFNYWEEHAAELTDKHMVHRPALGELVAGFSRELRARQAAIQGALTRKDTLGTVQHDIRMLLDFTLSQTQVFARAQAAASQAITLLIQSGRGGAAEEIGDLAIAAGTATREAIASTAAALALAMKLATAGRDGTDIELVRSASTLPFDTTLPDGRNTKLSKLDELPDGDFVEILAVVEAATAGRDGDGKLLGHLDLTDPSSGAQARAVGIFTDWRHVGVTRGSFCRFSATYHPSLAQLGGQAGLLIDRLAESQLASESWRFAFLRSARYWFEPFRNGHNMFWSMGPHDTSESLEDSDRVGAAELVFLKLLDRGNS